MKETREELNLIHPLLVIETRPGQKAREIAICPEITEDRGYARAVCAEHGSLKDFYEIIQTLIDKERVDSHGSFKLTLIRDPDGFLFDSLDELLDRLEELNSYQRIVICCPLKFLQCAKPGKENRDLTKIIYSPRQLAGHSSLKTLREFYADHTGDWARQRKNIHIYCSLRGAAHLWFDHIKNTYLINLTRTTRERLRGETTYS